MASTNITVDEEAYDILNSLKSRGQSYSQVIKEHFFRPADTCGDLLDAMERRPMPPINLKRLEKLINDRKRRSPRP